MPDSLNRPRDNTLPLCCSTATGDIHFSTQYEKFLPLPFAFCPLPSPMPLPPPLPESEGRDVLVRLRDVGRTFQMGEVSVVALKTFTLDVYQGELLVLLGPS